jgi:hypothetical protein
MNYSLDQKLKCPLTGKYMRHPVVASDGYTYERNELLEYLKHNNISPVNEYNLTLSMRENFCIEEIIELALSVVPNEKEHLYNENLMYENIMIDQNFIEDASDFVLKKVLLHSKYINHIDNDKWSVGHLICEVANENIINFFFENVKFDINLKTKDNETYLHLLCENDYLMKNKKLLCVLEKNFEKLESLINLKSNHNNYCIDNCALYTSNIEDLIFLAKKTCKIENIKDKLDKNDNLSKEEKETFLKKYENKYIVDESKNIFEQIKKDNLNENDTPKKERKERKSNKIDFVIDDYLNMDDSKITVENLKKCSSSSIKKFLKKNNVKFSNMNKKKMTEKIIEIILQKKEK